jgi:hypothetical protein
MISNADRPYLLETRALTTDERGREIFVGLTYDESLEFAGYHDGRPQTDDDFSRYTELFSKHETARLRVIFAENEARVTKPTMN